MNEICRNQTACENSSVSVGKPTSEAGTQTVVHVSSPARISPTRTVIVSPPLVSQVTVSPGKHLERALLSSPTLGEPPQLLRASLLGEPPQLPRVHGKPFPLSIFFCNQHHNPQKFYPSKSSPASRPDHRNKV